MLQVLPIALAQETVVNTFENVLNQGGHSILDTEFKVFSRFLGQF